MVEQSVTHVQRYDKIVSNGLIFLTNMSDYTKYQMGENMRKMVSHKII